MIMLVIENLVLFRGISHDLNTALFLDILLIIFLTIFNYLSLCACDCNCLWKQRRALSHLDLLLEV